MRAELSTTLAGEVSIEVIAETEFEGALLQRAWKLREYRTGNGQSKIPGGGQLGFYVPMFDMAEPGTIQKQK